MARGDIEVFLSCSFSSDDLAVNRIVQSVCAGLRLACTNVALGFSGLPPEKAREFIASTLGLIAVVTKRDALPDGEFMMPSAVREEISIAYGLGKRVLILGELGVRFDGFMNNYGTRLPFSRSDLTSPAFLEKLVASLYGFREDLAQTIEPPQYAREYVSENTRTMTALDSDDEGYYWTIATTKRLRFEESFSGQILSSVWPEVPQQYPPQAKPLDWAVGIDFASKAFDVDTAIKFISAERVSMTLRFRPDPQPGDVIEFTRTFKTRYLNPLFQADVPPAVAPAITVGDKRYYALEGTVVSERTRKFHLHYSFSERYGIRPEQVKSIAASHVNTADYLAPWEMERMETTIESYGRRLLVDVRLENPQPRHIYGIAWELQP